jgi:glycosyltransferase involved in cell wall biosynthesis
MEEVIAPKISVIMPVYNCEAYVKEAIDSILNQTFSDFEFLIIDDCSTDSTLSIVKSYGDPRINVIEKGQNTGYTNSLNSAILIAKGKYIARMDGDDISLPERFHRQYDFLERNPEVVICGTAIQIIGTKDIQRHPFNHNDLKIKLCFSSVFHHPTVMIKASVLKQNFYNKEFEPAEDYELWTRLAFLGKMANLEDVLLNYRIHSNQTSSIRKNLQDINVFKCQLLMLNKFFIEENFSINQIENVLNTSNVILKSDVVTSLSLYDYVIKFNVENKIFDQNTLKITLYNKQLFLFRNYLKNNSNSFSAIFFVLKNQGFFEFIKIVTPLKKIKKQFKRIL